MSKFGRARFFIFVLVFVLRDLELGEIPAISLSTKSYSDFNEIWYVDKCRWLMHDGMPYDPIKGQGQGYGASEVPKIAHFEPVFSLFSMVAGKWPPILKLRNNI